MGFSKQEYGRLLPWLPPGDLLNEGIEPWSPALQADSLLSEPPGKPVIIHQMLINYSCQNAEFESDITASYKYQFTSIIEDRCVWTNAMTLKVKVLVAQSCPTLCDSKAPLSMKFSKQEYWSGFPFPSPGDLPNSGVKPWSPVSQVYSLPSPECRIFY